MATPAVHNIDMTQSAAPAEFDTLTAEDITRYARRARGLWAESSQARTDFWRNLRHQYGPQGVQRIADALMSR
jgi:hypothetical protein